MKGGLPECCLACCRSCTKQVTTLNRHILVDSQDVILHS